MGEHLKIMPDFKQEMDSEGVLYACVQGSNDAIMLTDEEGIIFYVNPAWQTLFGYTYDEAVGNTPRLIRSHHHKKSFYDQMWSDLLDIRKAMWRGEVINRAKNGKEIPIALTISPFRDEKQETSGYMSIAVDLTEKKKMEMKVHWQDRLTTLGILTEGLAHEMGTPLGVARGRAEYLMRLSDQDSLANKSLGTIVEQIDKVSKLMEALQNLSCENESGLQIPVDLTKVVSSVQRLIEGKLQLSGIQFSSTITSDTFVLAEASRLGQCILSLCINSYQAFDTNKQSKHQEKKYLKVTAVEKGTFWEIGVEDNAGGILEAHVPNLFKPFFTTKDTGVGTGLGLVAVNQEVRRWGGHVEVANQLGHGVSFKLSLPKAPRYEDNKKEIKCP